MISVPQLETIEINLFENGVAEIAHNRPKRYNALSYQSYSDWLSAMKWAANDERVKVTVLTGRGKYYSSGQELVSPSANDNNLLERIQTTSNLVEEMIKFPKILIAAVNGPSMGFGTTTLALCDVVYSVAEASFTTPFMKLGFCAEGCSSVLFPRIMGLSKANEMLLLGREFSAQELVDCGLISRVLPSDNFRDSVLEIASEASKYSIKAVKITKALIRDVDREHLINVNKREMTALYERMIHPDTLKTIKKFLEESSAKKAVKKAKL